MKMADCSDQFGLDDSRAEVVLLSFCPVWPWSAQRNHPARYEAGLSKAAMPLDRVTSSSFAVVVFQDPTERLFTTDRADGIGPVALGWQGVKINWHNANALVRSMGFVVTSAWRVEHRHASRFADDSVSNHFIVTDLR